MMRGVRRLFLLLIVAGAAFAAQAGRMVTVEAATPIFRAPSFDAPLLGIANRAFQAPFTVEKKYWRTDPYDNQLGEIETAERGLMYEEFERRKEALMCEEIEEN